MCVRFQLSQICVIGIVLLNTYEIVTAVNKINLVRDWVIGVLTLAT